MTVTAGRLAGKVAVVTGAGSGMGRAAALLFAREGARVVCADRSGAQDKVAAEIGEAARAVHADVSVAADVQHMVEAAERHFGRLDVLCNNAGFGGPRKPITEQDESTFDEVLAVNLKGVFLGMRYGIASMLRTGGGSVVNTASAAGLVGWKGHSLYAAAKGGVVQMTKCAALDHATQNVRVNAVCPGMTWTGLAGATADTPEPPPDAVMKAQPMHRWGLPTELAAAMLFLASDEASFITGAALPVDGGYVVP
ncbi:NAD(P)-dependent dehydrogenase, short-chain alcohol dehydrogenase family [Streptomyces sp. yr375]|uniref:SDR family NAD(P)-dependent oxidoreductase n=1 Tax=Streptomyces sp. yr375 TaxID=1761906 RepID=UPI00055EDD86|nr:glucose 1-dehydrogenase [Streptomyces sp. yr375]SEQ00189.1 NAD(P)-dependent dehydrogenase, short-chain alcohol dehydrogenase family [Streptomyces sp. yr375]